MFSKGVKILSQDGTAVGLIDAGFRITSTERQKVGHSRKAAVIREHVAVHWDLAETAVVPRHLSGSIHAALAKKINKQSAIHEQTPLEINHLELNWVLQSRGVPCKDGCSRGARGDLLAGTQRRAGLNSSFHQFASCPPWSPLTAPLTCRCVLSFPVRTNPAEEARPRPLPHPPSTRHHQPTHHLHV